MMTSSKKNYTVSYSCAHHLSRSRVPRGRGDTNALRTGAGSELRGALKHVKTHIPLPPLPPPLFIM